METFGDPLFSKVHALAIGLLEGTLAPAERLELEKLLLESPAARQAYLQHVQETACLRWLCVEEFPKVARLASIPAERSRTSRRRRVAAMIFGGGLACALAAIAVNRSFFPGTDGQNVQGSETAVAAVAAPNKAEVVAAAQLPQIKPNRDARRPVATITGLGAVRWQAPGDSRQMLSRCAIGDRLRLRQGSAELTFDAGAQVTVFGPADFDITSATSIRCRRGRVTTLVDHRGKGFSIETPQAKVVDLGTQFGVSISDKGETEVVVFQGSIDLSYSARADAEDASGRRMQQGDALLFRKSGAIERLVSVQRNSFMSAGRGPGQRPVEPVIADVRDNIRKAESIKSYQIVRGGLDEDTLAFVDRMHQWNGVDAKGLPPFLVGADYIMPFNDDKFVTGLEIKVRLLRPATLYVFLDKNMAVPSWFRDGFTDTGMQIGLDCAKTEWHEDQSLGIGPGRSVDYRFSIWKRDVKQAGTVTLGGIEQRPADTSQGFNMYGIAAVAKH